MLLMRQSIEQAKLIFVFMIVEVIESDLLPNVKYGLEKVL
jgi:hypothetical protein